MRTPDVVAVATLTAASIAGVAAAQIEFSQQDPTLAVQTFGSGVSFQEDEPSALRSLGGGGDLNLRGDLTATYDAEGLPFGGQGPLFRVAAWQAFSTGSEPVSISASFEADGRVISIPDSENRPVSWSVVGAIYAASPAFAGPDGLEPVVEVGAGEGGLSGTGVSEIFAEGVVGLEEDRVFLPAFGEFFLAVSIEISTIGPSDELSDLTLELGGETPFEGLRIDLDGEPLPAPGGAILLAGAGLAALRRRRG